MHLKDTFGSPQDCRAGERNDGRARQYENESSLYNCMSQDPYIWLIFKHFRRALSVKKKVTSSLL